MSGSDPQKYNYVDGTLLCTPTFGVKKTKPFLHLSLGKAGPFTLESHICVKTLKTQDFPNN